MDSVNFSIEASVFHGREVPEKGFIVGYAGMIHNMQLPVPMISTISVICSTNKKYENEQWRVFPPKYQPRNILYKQLVFSLKYEGINLLFFKKLFKKLTKDTILELIQMEPTGQYCRKIWFLYEFLTKERLPLPDADVKIKYRPLLDSNLQYGVSPGEISVRHRLINNLPGNVNFCPMIFKTVKLEQYINQKLAEDSYQAMNGIHKDILLRASAFLLLKDSKASFTIEGESPKNKRTARWGQAIGKAGSNELNKNELMRLQQIVIENGRFIEMGYRQKGGFVGEHDRETGEPLPDHISAKWQDVEQLMDGLIRANELLIKSNMDAVLAATIIAFGFVFIHPFEDGNGRLHRYLIHHVLAKKQFSHQGIIFPVSASILDHIADYRKVLESYSQPLLDFIEWKETKDHNINVLNDTSDYYKYFDATRQAEFLYECVKDTIQNIIPNEVAYLTRYDEFKRYLDNEFEMPDKLVALLVQFLAQNSGKLSKRAREKEFVNLADNEVQIIEETWQKIFQDHRF
jgi:hypothetical protein